MFHKLQSLFSRALSSSTSAAAAAAGRKPMPVANEHFVLRGRPLAPPFPEGHKTAAFGTGCFWGAERAFWSIPDVYSTAVGYIAGEGEHPTYEEVCSGATGHNEVVQVVYDPKLVDFYDILKTFWEFHDPTQGNRQGNDHGTHYRSGIYCSDDEQLAMAARTASQYAEALGASGRHSRITTEIVGPAQKHVFYYAEDYHQQCVDLPPLDQENGDGATETSNTP